MNEKQEALLAWCYRVAHETPRPPYCATPCRFGQCSNRCFDCSGFTYMAYKSVGITIGADTGGIARNADPSDFVGKRHALPGDLMLHRQGSVYNGGSDEHVGLFVRYQGGRTYTWESAGSQHGVGYYSRDSNWWTDAVRIPALHSVPDSPAPVPEDDLTPEEHNWLAGIAMLTAKHDDMLNWIFGIEVEGGYPERGKNTPRIQQILADTQALRKKTGA